MDASIIKQEILQSLETDEMVHDSVGSDWTDSAPYSSGTNHEAITELKLECLMDNSAQLGMNDQIQHEKMVNSFIEPSPRMISNCDPIVIAPQYDNFEKCELFQTKTWPYSPEHQKVIKQETTTPTVEQEIMDVVIEEEITEDEINAKQVRGEVQNCEENIKLEGDINFSLDNKLKETVKTEAQPVMKNKISEDRLQKLIIKSESIFKQNMQLQLHAPDFSPEGMGIILTDYGVWSTRFLQKGTEFGLNDHRAVPSDSFAQEWISSLRKSTGDIRHNMEAKLLGSKMFYKLVTDIQPKTELILLEMKPTNNIDKRDNDSAKPCQELDTSVATKQKHSGTKSHQCRECGKTFIYKTGLEKHMVTHSGEKPHECKQCGKTYTQKGSLGRHVLSHSGGKPHECKQCGKFFALSGGLQKHMKIHAVDRVDHTVVKLFQCIECGKQFSHRNSLVSHMITHSGEKPHDCKQCGKRFTLKACLKKHMLIHSDDRPYECMECGNKFTQKTGLMNHMLTHSGEKPHECKQCGKFFSQFGNLNKHMKTHTKEKPFQCI